MSYKVKSKDRYKDFLGELRNENTVRWQIFGSFLLAHTVFLSFILTNAFQDNKIISYRIGPFFASILGIILTIPWLANFLRGLGYHLFRMAQAKEAEPTNWDLLTGDAEKFSEGKTVYINGVPYGFKWFSRGFKKGRAVKLVIILFLAFYISIMSLNGPWWRNIENTPPNANSSSYLEHNITIYEKCIIDE